MMKKSVQIRLDEETISKLQLVEKKIGISKNSIIAMWVVEKLNDTLKELSINKD